MKTFISIILLTFFGSTLTLAQNWNGVIVGYSPYHGDLQWSINDANAMKYNLENYKQWSSSRITQLTDASEDGLRNAMLAMSTNAGNTNLFYFSGYGDIDGLVPYELSATIAPSELQTNFGSTYNQCTAFLDASYAGIFPRDMTKGVISSACAANEQAVESDAIQHGYFTYYVLQGLQQSTLNTSEQVHSYAAPLTTQAKPTQHPQLGDNFQGYLSIYNAPYTLSGTLQRYETWSGSVTLTGNVTVPSGITLTITPGTIVTVGSGKKLSIYGGGSLIVNGATFQGNGSQGYWNSISFYANSSGSIQNSTIKDAQAGIYATTKANVTISGNTITNNSLYGMSITQNSNVTISNCTISNNGTGISVSSSSATITGNDILNNTNYGINANNISNSFYWHDNTLQGNGYAMLLNNASPYIYNNFISDNAHGVVITSSSPNFVNPSNPWRGYNAITCASTPLFKAENYSTVYMGYDGNGGYNSIFGSDLPDMQSLNHSGTYADNNYWGSPNPQVYADGTSWILARTPLGSDPNPGSECGGYLASSSLASNSSYVEGDISNKYWEAISQGRSGNPQKAKELLQLIIEGKFDQKYSPLALLSLYEFSVNDKTGLNSNLMEIYNRAKDDLLRPFAIRLLARETALSDNNKEMIFYNTELINNYPNSVNELTALYDLVVYYAETEQDLTRAKGFYSRMREAYPDEDLTLFAGINLGINLGDLKKKTLDEKIPETFYLSDAFPNPFNPTTKITYQLPIAAQVTLKVYDLLGREVATLVNEEKQAGKYEVEFDASNLSSGVYLYRISINDFVKTMKMVVVK
jgi:parallel beta-helix repeat protein